MSQQAAPQSGPGLGLRRSAQPTPPAKGKAKAEAAVVVGAADDIFPLAARRALASLNREAARQRRAQRAEQGRRRKPKRTVAVDSSRAKTSAEALRICVQQLKWREFPTGRHLFCDIYWHGVSFHDGEVSCSSQVNKYPGMMEMTRKINFSRAVRTMQELFPDEYKFYPRSWILPEEYQHFVDQKQHKALFNTQSTLELNIKWLYGIE